MVEDELLVHVRVYVFVLEFVVEFLADLEFVLVLGGELGLDLETCYHGVGFCEVLALGEEWLGGYDVVAGGSGWPTA